MQSFKRLCAPSLNMSTDIVVMILMTVLIDFSFTLYGITLIQTTELALHGKMDCRWIYSMKKPQNILFLHCSY